MSSSIPSVAISEIFSSLQGEGVYLGARHLFVRFESCNLNCSYCDEASKVGLDLTPEAILRALELLEHEKGSHQFVSLTGGEPLYYGSFLAHLCPALKNAGFKLYLETNGVLWEVLQELIGWFDVIAMDMKLPSVSKGEDFFDAHRYFLKIAAEKEVFVKVIISKSADLAEFDLLCGIIKGIGNHIPLVLQPISEAGIEGHEEPELMRFLDELQKRASNELKDVRIIPRLHKILNLK